MGIADDILTDWRASAAALAWQVEMGVTEAIGETTMNAFDLADPAPGAGAIRARAADAAAPGGARGGAGDGAGAPAQVTAAEPGVDAVAAARSAAQAADSLAKLQRAIAAFDHCPLKKGARSTVFADGRAGARVLILGEAPGRDEDLEGRPFVGRAGQLLDRMFAAIGLDRRAESAERAVYITNVLPWRPPGNRDPEADEIAMMLPFVERHIELAAPQVIVTMGNTPLFALRGVKGILRARGQWGQALGRPHLPMLHPAYLLRNPSAKRQAWDDLLSLLGHLRQSALAGGQR